MIRVYDLNKDPRFGEVLVCRCYASGDSIERLRFTIRFSDQSDPVEVCCFRDTVISCHEMLLELQHLCSFVESKHWRDAVAKQWERYNALFEEPKDD